MIGLYGKNKRFKWNMSKKWPIIIWFFVFVKFLIFNNILDGVKG